MEIKVKIDAKALQKVLGTLSPKAARAVLGAGLRKAATSTKKQSVDLIMQHYNLKRKDASVNVKTKLPKSDYAGEATVTIQAQPIGLEKFRPRTTKKGLSVSVEKTKGKQLLASTFMMKSKTGRKVTAIRTTRVTPQVAPYVLYPSKKKPTSRLPVNRLMADPTSIIVGPQADAIADRAAEEATLDMVVRTENLLNKGLG